MPSENDLKIAHGCSWAFLIFMAALGVIVLCALAEWVL